MSENFTIKTFVRRNAKTSARQKQIYTALKPIYCIKATDHILNLHEVFGNDHPIIIEIGFGSGDATYKIALDNPEKNYLCIEVFQSGVAKLLTKIQDHCIKNIRIIEHDAMEVLKSMIADNSIEAFHIFFPDPWPKKRHHKRRLMQSDKIRLFTEKLTAGGYIYFVTDWQEYAEKALAACTDVSSLCNRYENFAEKQSWRPQTHFEEKALIAGRNIYELLFEKRRN